MDRTLHVLVYPSRLFAAHWSFWLPYIEGNNVQSHIGDRIHVTGDRLNGFQYEYIRNYNVREDDRRPNAFPIGLVSETHLSRASKDENVTTTEDGQGDEENIALNSFDEACREVPAPGPSLNKVDRADVGKATGAPPKKAEAKDCQWWIKEAASHLTLGYAAKNSTEQYAIGIPYLTRTSPILKTKQRKFTNTKRQTDQKPPTWCFERGSPDTLEGYHPKGVRCGQNVSSASAGIVYNV
ncbi:hypothetical protein GGR54DRAFT_653356 [Hypoxylon sp. NC1633]|nr:hypothetical protein GGR54DRAFT_653356 [Hypoxylon sp. NC1633]